MYQWFKKFMKSLDLFGAPVSMYIDKKSNSTSFCGGIFTIVILILFLIIAGPTIVLYLTGSELSSNVAHLYSDTP